MRIAIDAHAIGSRLTGNETYIRNLLEALARIDQRNEYDLYFTHPEARSEWEGRFPNFNTLSIPKNPVPRLLYAFPIVLAKRKTDLLHVQYTMPPLSPVPVVATIHDISYEHFPAYFTRKDRLRARITIRQTAQQAAHVLTVSKYSQDDIVRTYKVPRDRVTVTYNGVNDRFRPVGDTALLQAMRDRYGIRAPYILSVGNLQPRKNLPALLDAFARLVDSDPGLPHQLVIVGKKAWLYDGIFAALGHSKVKDRIVLTDYVPDDDLPALYSGADCFIYPSLFEGFGLPPLEAMACGTPAIVGDNSALPEVVDEAGLRVDATRVEALTVAMASLVKDAELRGRLRAAGLRRAAEFTWDRCARETLGVFEHVGRRRLHGVAR